LRVIGDPQCLVHDTGFQRTGLGSGVEKPRELFGGKTVALCDHDQAGALTKADKGCLHVEREQTFATIRNDSGQRASNCPSHA